MSGRRALTTVLSLALLSVMLSCASKPCPIPPCPAPGFDVRTCRCKPQSSAVSPAPRAGVSGAPAAAGASGDPISFPCGSTTCDSRSQICEEIVGGPLPGLDSHDCIPIPKACVHDDSCACVVAALSEQGATRCSSDAGFPSVRFDIR
jgi:hypothetical protein